MHGTSKTRTAIVPGRGTGGRARMGERQKRTLLGDRIASLSIPGLLRSVVQV